MAYLDDLIRIRDQAAEVLVQITSEPKPSYRVHSHDYSWGEYMKQLTDTIDRVNKLIAQGSPVEEIGFGA